MPGIRRLTDKSGGIGVVYSGEDRKEVVYCHRCLEMANVRSKLGNRIYLPEEFGKVVIHQMRISGDNVIDAVRFMQDMKSSRKQNFIV